MTATGEAQETSQTSTIPPVLQLRQMTSGFWVRWMLYAVAERGVPDLLADGPLTSTEMAQATGLHEPTLYRILRTLSSFGVFTEESPRRFALTPLSSALKTGDPSAARDDWFARSAGGGDRAGSEDHDELIEHSHSARQRVALSSPTSG